MNETDRDPITGLFPIRTARARRRIAPLRRPADYLDIAAPSHPASAPWSEYSLRPSYAHDTGPERRMRLRCRSETTQAIRAGKLVRPTLCDVCGCADEIEAHHEDYSNPLLIWWLCPPCHRTADRARRAL